MIHKQKIKDYHNRATMRIIIANRTSISHTYQKPIKWISNQGPSINNRSAIINHRQRITHRLHSIINGDLIDHNRILYLSMKAAANNHSNQPPYFKWLMVDEEPSLKATYGHVDFVLLSKIGHRGTFSVGIIRLINGIVRLTNGFIRLINCIIRYLMALFS